MPIYYGDATNQVIYYKIKSDTSSKYTFKFTLDKNGDSWNYSDLCWREDMDDKKNSEKSKVENNDLVRRIKIFFNQISSIDPKFDHVYYLLHDVPTNVIILLKEMVCNFRKTSYKSIGSSPSKAEIPLLNSLRDFSGYVSYNLLKGRTINQSAQVLFTRIKNMFYTEDYRKYILFVEDGDRRRELTKVVELSNILGEKDVIFKIEHFMGEYHSITSDITVELDITVGVLILTVDEQEPSLHDILINNY